ncbi:MAG TPA: CopG family transcriptional regulator [Candidatus Limnocylindria bacterium]|nr:CopG family transcriptional regulator [Candidatus Limnocylindria bacterium]
MKRTSILLDPGLLAELEGLARRKGVPTAHVIRGALEAYVAEQTDGERQLPGFVGIGRGPGDVAERIEELLPADLEDPAR